MLIAEAASGHAGDAGLLVGEFLDHTVDESKGKVAHTQQIVIVSEDSEFHGVGSGQQRFRAGY